MRTFLKFLTKFLGCCPISPWGMLGMPDPGVSLVSSCKAFSKSKTISCSMLG